MLIGSATGPRNDFPVMTIWRSKDPLILASQSRARQLLLANAGIAFEAVPADINERAVQGNSGLTAPDNIALLLAREKALFVSAKFPGRVVVGADQTLALNNSFFSKPSAGAGRGTPDARRQKPPIMFGRCGGTRRQDIIRRFQSA
jgi:hypothetical protein